MYLATCCSPHSVSDTIRSAEVCGVEVHVGWIVVPYIAVPAGNDTATATEVVEGACAAAARIIFGVVVDHDIPVDDGLGDLVFPVAGDAIVTLVEAKDCAHSGGRRTVRQKKLHSRTAKDGFAVRSMWYRP